MVSFCFVSFNTQAFESTYLVCSANNETVIYGFVMTLSDRLQNITNKRQHGYKIAHLYIANSEGDDFIERPDGDGVVTIYDNSIVVGPWGENEEGSYSIDRISGDLFHEWGECTDPSLPSSLCFIMDKKVYKSKLIGSCNKITESEAKAKARQLYTPAPEPKRKF